MEKLGDFYIEVRCKTTGDWERFSDLVPFEIEIPKKTKSFFGFKYRIDDLNKICEDFDQGLKKVHQKLAAEARAFMDTKKYEILYENIRISGDYWDPTFDPPRRAGNGRNSFLIVQIRGDYWRNGRWQD